MLCIPLFLLILLDCHTIQALFIVTAPTLTYTAMYGQTVQMECNFPVPKEDDLNRLKVSWQHFPPKLNNVRQVTMFNNGREDVLSQDNTYKRRASLVIQELKNGVAILKVEEVKLTDAGTYLCALELGGSDYQEIRLIVQASYSNIETSSHISEDNEISLTCESLGFPEAKVYWKQNGVNVSFPVNTSHTQTTDGFYKVRSTIKGIDESQSYKCVFWNKALTEKTEASPKYSGHVELLTHGSNHKRYPQQNDSGHYTQPIVVIISAVGCTIFLVGMIILYFNKRHWCFKCFKKKGDCSSAL